MNYTAWASNGRDVVVLESVNPNQIVNILSPHEIRRTENSGASLTVGRVDLERGSPPVIHGTSLAETRGQVEDGLAPSFRENGA